MDSDKPDFRIEDLSTSDGLRSSSRVTDYQIADQKIGRLRTVVRDVVGRLDKAITLGVASAYPIVLNIPTPDPVPDWKRVVRIGWKFVKTTFVETVRILTDQSRKK
jgi:hypothetical protein